MSECDIRQEAYRYILEKLKSLPVHAGVPYQPPDVTLDELLLLKEGLADPSAGLVSLLKQQLQGHVTETEIDAHLVAPFVKTG
jgi:hypothetical protein